MTSRGTGWQPIRPRRRPRALYICEFEFYLLDVENPNYALGEVDIYAGVPPGLGEPNHRLALRKNARSGKYEVYRHYLDARIRSSGGLTALTFQDSLKEVVAFESASLDEAVAFVNREYRRFHSIDPDKDLDQVCKHERPDRAQTCDADRFLDVLICPRCGKEYEGFEDLPDAVRMMGHLTGFHYMSGDDLRWTLEYAQNIKARAEAVLRRAAT